MMARCSVSLILLLFTCVYAVPVPENAKISLIRNSNFGLGVASGQSKTVGLFEGNNKFSFEVVKETIEGERRPDFSLLENVNTGAALAVDKSISIGVFKDNILAGKNPFEGFKLK